MPPARARPCRYEEEEACCVSCGYVAHEPLKEIKVTPFEDEWDDSGIQNGRYGYRRIVGEGLVVNMSELEALSRILEIAALGTTWYGIARILNDEGWRNRRGKEWNTSGVRSITLKERKRMKGKQSFKAALFQLN